MKFFCNQPIKAINSKYRQISSLWLFLFMVISVVLYVIQPVESEMSMSLFYMIFVMMLTSVFFYFKTKKKRNYIDFDTIFIFIYCLSGFSASFFYNTLLYRSLFIGFPVSTLYINRGNLLVLIGLLGYMLGSLSIPSFIRGPSGDNGKVVNTLFLSILLLSLSMLFITSGGISFYRAIYTNEPTNGDTGAGISVHILLLLITTAIVIIATELYNKKNVPLYRMRKISVLSIFLLVLLLLWIGNRTAASMLFLPFLGIYTMYFYNMRFKQFILFVFIGIFAMWIVQNTRANVEIDFSRPVLIILDLTIPSRQIYTALEYVEQYGHTYGMSMSNGVIGVIPFLPSLVANFITANGGNPRYLGSAEMLTDYTHRKNNTPIEHRIGLGTTIIADIFLSFGLPGVIFFMFLLGYIIQHLLLKSLNFNYFSLIALSAMLANSVFIVRASYTHPIRFLVWALIMAHLNKFVVSYFK